jgi:hypothetical protein
MAGLGGVVEEPLLRLRRRVYDESPQMGGQRLLSERKLAAGLIEFSAGDIETLSVIGLAAAATPAGGCSVFSLRLLIGGKVLQGIAQANAGLVLLG